MKFDGEDLSAEHLQKPFVGARQDYRRPSDFVRLSSEAGFGHYAKSFKYRNGPAVVCRHLAEGTRGGNDVGVFSAS